MKNLFGGGRPRSSSKPLLQRSSSSEDDYLSDSSSSPIYQRMELSSGSIAKYVRILNTDGTVNVIKKNVSRLKLNLFKYDSFHTLINSPWWKLTLFIALSYIFVWFLFGLGYFICIEVHPTECISNVHVFGLEEGSKFEHFSAGFFFSVQSQQTIGYGNMSPTNYASNMLVTVQAVVGVLMEACTVGLVYAKFARATTRAASLMWSKNIIIGNRNGKKCLVFRIVDIRKHFLVEPHIRVYLAHNESTSEGEKYLEFTPLKVTIGDSYVVFLSGYPLTVVHPIDEESPLNDLTKFKQGEIVAFLEGTDSTTANSVQARYSYTYNDLVFNAHFADACRTKSNGQIEVDFGKFHQVVKRPN